MLKLIFLFLLTFLGYNHNPKPVRLQKQVTFTEKFHNWINMHFYELLLIILIAVMIIFVLAIIVSAPGLGVESGVYYNHLEDVV